MGNTELNRTQRLLLGIRDVVAVIAIAVIIPLLSYRIARFIASDAIQQQERIEKELTQLRIENRSNTETVEEREKKAELNQVEKTISTYKFYTSLTIGLLSIVAGIFMPMIQIGVGLILAGIGTMSYGYWTHWDHVGELTAIISLVIALAALMVGVWAYRPGTK